MNASDWVQRWSHLVPPGGTVLDVACGTGRHVHWFAGRGHRVTAVDRDAALLAPLSGKAETVAADLEAGPWPLADRRFDAIVVTHYLWRPLLPVLVSRLAVGGLLLYETFAEGQHTVGRPSNPDFLLRSGELLEAAAGLHVVAYEHGFKEVPGCFVQRIAALNTHFSGDRPVRHPLAPPGVSPRLPEGG